MDASILLIGSENFCRFLLDLVRKSSTLTIERATNPLEAMPLILAQQPDLILIQASQPDSLELCRLVKAQNRLAWIYCIVVDDPTGYPEADRPIAHQGVNTHNAQVTQAISQRWNYLAQLEQEIAALEAGADAYIWLSTSDAEQMPHRLLHQLFQAQMQTGLRQVQTHRELMRTNDVLSAIALSDPLTSLNNRRAFEWELPRQIQNARNRGGVISLIMLDVDFFKSINDTYGHLAGDQVLKFLTARLHHNLRMYDTLFRYGGEEFVVILNKTDAQEAFLIANRLCQLISEQSFAIDEQIDLTVTISAGTATLSDDDDAKGMTLLQRADQCLLQAKAQGRNRVVGGESGGESN
jgi:two-component system cell cycle response regulator